MKIIFVMGVLGLLTACGAPGDPMPPASKTQVMP